MEAVHKSIDSVYVYEQAHRVFLKMVIIFNMYYALRNKNLASFKLLIMFHWCSKTRRKTEGLEK